MKKKTIVLIDDDREFLEELRETLEGHGFEAIAVNDAGRAVAIVEQVGPDLVLIDLKMPRKSGYEVSGELSQCPAMAGIPIIAMSAYYKDGDFPLLQVQGIRRCLRKPFKPTDIIQIIEEIEKKK